jgi:hypothetical protein
MDDSHSFGDDFIQSSLPKCLTERCSDCSGTYFSSALRRMFTCQCTCHLGNSKHLTSRSNGIVSGRLGQSPEKYRPAQILSDICICSHYEEDHDFKKRYCTLMENGAKCPCSSFVSEDDHRLDDPDFFASLNSRRGGFWWTE